LLPPARFPWRGALTASALYGVGFLGTLLLHELGHALLSKALGGQPVLHNTFVASRNETLSRGATLAIALAGPLVSLVQGLWLLAAARRASGTGNLALLSLYGGWFGLINFLGYLLIGPLFPYGDLGQVEALLGLPAWVGWGLALAAGLGLRQAIGATAPTLLRFGPGLGRARRGQLGRALVAVPWLVGSALLVALSWPAPTLLSVLYPPLSSLVLLAAWGAALRQLYPPADAAPAAAPLLGGLPSRCCWERPGCFGCWPPESRFEDRATAGEAKNWLASHQAEPTAPHRPTTQSQRPRRPVRPAHCRASPDREPAGADFGG